jgi:hypothetical protein
LCPPETHLWRGVGAEQLDKQGDGSSSSDRFYVVARQVAQGRGRQPLQLWRGAASSPGGGGWRQERHQGRDRPGLDEGRLVRCISAPVHQGISALVHQCISASVHHQSVCVRARTSLSWSPASPHMASAAESCLAGLADSERACTRNLSCFLDGRAILHGSWVRMGVHAHMRGSCHAGSGAADCSLP